MLEVKNEFDDRDPLYVTYDLSAPILNIDATFASGVEGTFTVVTACGVRVGDAVDELYLGVIPTEHMTDELLEQSSSGGFDDLLIECGEE